MVLESKEESPRTKLIFFFLIQNENQIETRLNRLILVQFGICC